MINPCLSRTPAPRHQTSSHRPADRAAPPAASRRRSAVPSPACPTASPPVCPVCNWTATAAVDSSAGPDGRRCALRCSPRGPCAVRTGCMRCSGWRGWRSTPRPIQPCLRYLTLLKSLLHLAGPPASPPQPKPSAQPGSQDCRGLSGAHSKTARKTRPSTMAVQRTTRSESGALPAVLRQQGLVLVLLGKGGHGMAPVGGWFAAPVSAHMTIAPFRSIWRYCQVLQGTPETKVGCPTPAGGPAAATWVGGAAARRQPHQTSRAVSGSGPAATPSAPLGACWCS